VTHETHATPESHAKHGAHAKPEARAEHEAVEKTVETGGGVQIAGPVGLAAGAVLAGRYQIEAAIGEGGTGQVFRAWDRVLGEPIALKILRPDCASEKSWIKRLAREVRVARAIRHPNVCRVFDLGSADGHWFVSMELAAGGTLRDTVRSGAAAARPLADRIADARAVCAGLAAIHSVGITHRDVTPQNVLRMEDGRLVLSDFGLAIERNTGADVSLHGGTPSYMPPEAAMHVKPDARSDVWQLGLLLHEILFGRRPAWRQVPGRGSVLRGPAEPSAPALEQALARLVSDCLAPSPGDRPASAVAVAGLFEAATEARPRGLLARWTDARPGTRARRRLVTLGLLGAFAAATVTVAALVGPRHRAAASAPEPVWDGARREAARRAFLNSGVPGAAGAFDQVDRLFRRYAPQPGPPASRAPLDRQSAPQK
jgi:hypothetical protein